MYPPASGRRKRSVGTGLNRAFGNTCVLVRDAYVGVRYESSARILHRPGDGSRGSALREAEQRHRAITMKLRTMNLIEELAMLSLPTSKLVICRWCLVQRYERQALSTTARARRGRDMRWPHPNAMSG